MFRWSSDYETGIRTIDEQHKKLVSIGAKLEDMLYAGYSADYYDYIIETINELKDYAEYHFSFEEKRKEECGYERLEIHRMEHLYFVKRIDRLSLQDIDSQQISVIRDTLNFLAKWLFGHILKEDMMYVDCLRKNENIY
ncbi:MAG: hemerythrin family protein [Clostridiaceae bacterium]|jgi:hemerythrin|nr:hemerythrin family protein [Clostridiaceae bacterium]